MKYNHLGNTGLLVSELCFGAMTFGGRGIWKAIGQQSMDDARELMVTAVENGINFFDNANAYSEGLAEEIMGEILKELPDSNELVIATKLRLRMGSGPNQVGLSRHHIHQEVENSLHRLNRDRIDVLYVHGVDHITPLQETLRGLEDVVRSGKVRYLGICNYPAWMIAKANGIANSKGWTPFTALQYYYSLAGRDIENDILPMAQAEKLAVIPWSPLAGGFLSGKYDRNTEKAGNSRRDDFDFPPLDKEKAYDIIDVLKEIAAARSKSPAQIALKWVTSRPGVTSTIIGAKNKEQLNENLESIHIELAKEEFSKLDGTSAIAQPYPNWMMDFQMGDRLPTT